MIADWKLDFVRARPFSPKRATLLGMILALIGLVSVLYTLSKYQYQRDALEELSMQEAIQAKHAIKPVIEPKSANSKAELLQVANTVNLLGISWIGLLEGMEQVAQRDVALISVVPDARKQQLVLQGEARNIDAALRYVEALKTLPMLQEVHLQRHQMQISDYMPVEFVIAAHWITP